MLKKGVKNNLHEKPNKDQIKDLVGSPISPKQALIFTPEQSQEIMDKFKAIVNTRLDQLNDTKGADGELYAYSIAVNQVKKKVEKEKTSTKKPMDKDQKLKEMIQAALSKPLSEKKKSAAFTSEYDDKFTDGRKNLPDGLQKSILKKQGELDEVNLGHNEISSIHQEGRFWIVSYETMDGKKEKVFQSEDEARKFASTLNEDLDLGHQDDEPHMLKADLYRIGKYAMELYKMVDQFEGEQEVDFPHWWQSKIIKAKDMLVSAKHYLDFELKEPQVDAMVDVASEEEAIDEKFASKAQQKYLYATNPKAAEKLGSKMTKKDYKNLPEKIKEAILAKLKESKGEYAQIEKKISDLQAKGKNAGDPEMQKLIKRRAELEKSKK
jgi:hypothetical protein